MECVTKFYQHFLLTDFKFDQHLHCGAFPVKKWLGVVLGKAWERHTPTERLRPWMSGHPCETPWETFCRTPWETETFVREKETAAVVLEEGEELAAIWQSAVTR